MPEDIASSPTPSKRSVLEGAFTLLDAMMTHQSGVGVSQLSHFCGLPKATVHRLLDQLADLGVVEKTDTRYRIGSRVFRLGLAWQPYPGLLAAARLPLHQLATTTGRSAALLVKRAGRVLIAAASLARQEDAAVLRPGAILPAGTIWQRDLGVVLVTAPVRASDSELVGAVALLLPVGRSSDSRAEAVRRAARAIGAALLH